MPRSTLSATALVIAPAFVAVASACGMVPTAPPVDLSGSAQQLQDDVQKLQAAFHANPTPTPQPASSVPGDYTSSGDDTRTATVPNGTTDSGPAGNGSLPAGAGSGCYGDLLVLDGTLSGKPYHRMVCGNGSGYVQQTNADGTPAYGDCELAQSDSTEQGPFQGSGAATVLVALIPSFVGSTAARIILSVPGDPMIGDCASDGYPDTATFAPNDGGEISSFVVTKLHHINADGTCAEALDGSIQGISLDSY